VNAPSASTILDRNRVLERLRERGRVELELGCGATKRNANAIGVDALDLPGVDLVGDVFEVLAAFPEAQFDIVGSRPTAAVRPTLPSST